MELLFHVCVPNEISKSSSFDIEDLAFSLTCMEFSCEEKIKRISFRVLSIAPSLGKREMHNAFVFVHALSGLL